MEVDYKLRLCLGPVSAKAVVAIVFEADGDVSDSVQIWLPKFKRLCSAPNYIPEHLKEQLRGVHGVDFCIMKVSTADCTVAALAFELLDQVQSTSVHRALELTRPYAAACGWRNLRLAYLYGWH